MLPSEMYSFTSTVTTNKLKPPIAKFLRSMRFTTKNSYSPELTTWLTIIDYDVDDYKISKEIQEDIEAADEDAPQIVAVIDDRPPSLRVDEKTNSLLWEPLGGEDDVKPELPIKVNRFQFKKTTLNTKNVLSTMKTPTDILKKKIERDIKKEKNHQPRSKEGEISQRRKTIRNQSNFSPRERRYSTDDTSPRMNDKNSCPLRVIKKEPDNVSSLRKIHQGCQTKKTDLEKTLQGWIKEEPNDSNGDFSPPRKKNISPLKNDTDISLTIQPSNYAIDENNSPPRKNAIPSSSSNKNLSSYQGGIIYSRNEEDMSPPRKKSQGSDGDISPPRKRDAPNKRSSHQFLLNSSVNRRDLPERSHRDMPPPRKQNEDDMSPGSIKKYSSPRKRRNTSPTKRIKNERGRSPDREKNDHHVNSRWGDWSPDRGTRSTKKLQKTMSGKRAGLQVAKDLHEELAVLKEKEDKIFQSLSKEVSGKNATTVLRRLRVENPEEVARKLQREQEMKEKYDRWGKGLKQVENENKQMAYQLYEMGKPLARYVDDEDLEKYLKDQEREGDPMLDYIRKKKKKKVVEKGLTDKPVYMGEFMPNRFGIRPGYRWDGVDRSNEYEKRWFEKLNARKAVQEEAFKWSTEDM